jgi:hypothetical protein
MREHVAKFKIGISPAKAQRRKGWEGGPIGANPLY